MYQDSFKYQSLKQESLNNNIYKMDIKIWNETLQNATLYSSTQKVKEMKAADIGTTNNAYEVNVNSPFCISHLLVLMMYTNLSNLQYNYKKYGCKYSEKAQNENDMKTYHREIANWYKLLQQAVKFFGAEMKTTDILFTGMSVPLVFGTFNPLIECPISTTTSYQIAHNFTQKKGIILKYEAIERLT